MAKISLLILTVCLCALVSLATSTDDEDLEILPVDDEVNAEETDNGGEASDKNVNEDGFEIEDSVLILTADNFDKAVEKYPTLLAEFYAPWCGHCKNLAPKYAEAAGILSKNDPPVMLAKVDATVETELGQRFEVQGYPTLRFFKDGKDYDYEGPRDTDGIVDYMKNIASPSWKPEPDAVVTLTSHNFNTVIEREELMLVEFYAPWCGHCKRFAPTYEKAAKILKKEDPPIVLAKVDAAHETDLAAEYGITGYPTLKVFKKGRAREYKGERQREYDVVSYMLNQRGDGAEKVDTLKALKNFFLVDDISIVGFFNSPEDVGVQAYKDVADELREDYHFAIVYDESIRKAYKVNPGSMVIFNAERFYTKFEPKWHVQHIADDTSSDDVKGFIEKHNLPLVGHYSSMSSVSKRYDSRRPLCLVFYTVDFGFDHREATQLWRNKIAAIAKKYPDITFAVADDEENNQLLKDFGLDESSEEMNIGLYGSDKRRYGMEPMEEFESDEIIEFLDKYKKGKLEPVIKSQRVPKKQTGPVTTVVGNSFEKIVLDKSKDVLIEMYAPWCGHCKKLEPIYADLAKKLKSEKNLVIAKMDATANDSPDNFSASGFPTIYFAPAKDKENPVKYGGDRDLESFENFLREKATVSFGKGAKEEL